MTKLLYALLHLLTLAALLGSCGGQPTEATATTASALSVGSPLCFKAGGDSLARYPWEAAYPLGAQHVYCQEMVGETNSFQWPSWASVCSGAPGLRQADVYAGNYKANGSLTFEFCTRTDVTVERLAGYVETMELGWLASGTKIRRVSRVVLGRGTSLTISDQAVAGSGCPVPAGNCVAGVVPATGTTGTVAVGFAATSLRLDPFGPPVCVADPGFTLDAPVACSGFTHCMACTESNASTSSTVAGCVMQSVASVCAGHCSECYEP